MEIIGNRSSSILTYTKKNYTEIYSLPVTIRSLMRQNCSFFDFKLFRKEYKHLENMLDFILFKREGTE